MNIKVERTVGHHKRANLDKERVAKLEQRVLYYNQREREFHRKRILKELSATLTYSLKLDRSWFAIQISLNL